MKKISRWANLNKSEARGSIVLIKIILAWLAFYIGNQMDDIGITFSSNFFFGTALIFTIAALVYPRRDRKHLFKLSYYFRQKCCDITLAFSTFVMMCCLFNTNLLSATHSSSRASNSNYATLKTEQPTAEEILSSLSYRKKNSLTAKEKRILKLEFKKQILIYGKAKMKGDEARAKAALPVILAILVAIGLTILLGYLACSVSCGGADGAAIAIAVLGLAAIIIALVLVIKGIHKRAQRKVLEKHKAEETTKPVVPEPVKQ